jgi:hypothetical protein
MFCQAKTCRDAAVNWKFNFLLRTDLVAGLAVVLAHNVWSGSTLPGAGWTATRFTSFRAARPNISREIPVISRFTPTRVPIAHTELDIQWNQVSPPQQQRDKRIHQKPAGVGDQQGYIRGYKEGQQPASK